MNVCMNHVIAYAVLQFSIVTIIHNVFSCCCSIVLFIYILRIYIYVDCTECYVSPTMYQCLTLFFSSWKLKGFFWRVAGRHLVSISTGVGVAQKHITHRISWSFQKRSFSKQMSRGTHASYVSLMKSTPGPLCFDIRPWRTTGSCWIFSVKEPPQSLGWETPTAIITKPLIYATNMFFHNKKSWSCQSKMADVPTRQHPVSLIMPSISGMAAVRGRSIVFAGRWLAIGFVKWS